MDDLNELERMVLVRLTSGTGEDFERLRRQVDVVKVVAREYTGFGFFLDLIAPVEVEAVSDCPAGTLGTLCAECRGLKGGVGFLVFLVDGRLKLLEGFSYEEEWLEFDPSAIRFDDGSKIELQKAGRTKTGQAG